MTVRGSVGVWKKRPVTPIREEEKLEPIAEDKPVRLIYLVTKDRIVHREKVVRVL